MRLFSLTGPSAHRLMIAAVPFKNQHRPDPVSKLCQLFPYPALVSTMLTLMDLPNEILSSIIEATEPEDIVSFVTCCKLMYSLARDKLEEHKEKNSLFSTIFVEDDILSLSRLYGAKYDRSKIQLREFFSDERNRFYPKSMVVFLPPGGGYDEGRTAKTSAFDWPEEVGEQLECRMAEVHSMMGLDIGGIEAEEWGKLVKAGDLIAIFLLLLALLPNLERFSVENLGQLHQALNANCSKIMRLMTEAALEQNENGPGFGGRLSECTVNGCQWRGVEENLLPFFMMLPKMRRIRGYDLGVEDCSWPYADAVSPLVDLDLHGGIDTVTLSKYIRGIRELKRFRSYYEYDEEIGWEPRGIVSTLRQFAFRSLVHLDLTTDVSYGMIQFDSPSGIVSLRSFEVLETARLHCILLFERVQTAYRDEEVYSVDFLLDGSLIKAQRLIDFLPSSLRIFQLESIDEGEIVLDTFEGFPEQRAERLPNLELISLDAGDELNSKIGKICKEAGVQMGSSKENSAFSDIGSAFPDIGRLVVDS